MFEIGQKVRVKADVDTLAAGHVGTITGEDHFVDEPMPEGSMSYRVLFDDPNDKGWIGWVSDTWLNGYELEAVESTSFEDGVRSAATFVRNNVNKGDLIAKQILAAFGLKEAQRGSNT